MASVLRSPLLLFPATVRTPSATDAPRVAAAGAVVPFRVPLGRQWATGLRGANLAACYFHKAAALQRIRRPFAAYGESTETGEVDAPAVEEESEEIEVENGASDGSFSVEDKTTSVVITSLQSYKEALANGDQSTAAEIEAFLLSIEEERESLAKKVASLSEELSIERDRVLRISADFDNFRKRTERERLSLMTNAQGEVVESLLPVLDNFERAKAQIKVETEGEEKINNSYQSIYKQFVEIMNSLGVETVETVGHPFDPMLHEAIMREESMEFEEGIILQEFRKGFKLGDRLLRPSMVKVSAGPGPAKTEVDLQPEAESSNEETSTENTEEQGEST